MNLQLFGNGGAREQELRNAMLQSLTETTNQLASTLYTHTWKTRITPDGNQIISLRASARRTSGSGFTSWPTPVAEPANGTPEAFLERKRRSVAKTGRSMGIVLSDLAMVSTLASWPTPQANNAERGGSEQRATNPERSNDLHDFALLAAWPTPMAVPDSEASHGQQSGQYRKQMDDLIGWTTPSSRDWKDTPGMATTATNPDGTERARLDQLPRQANLAAWPTPTEALGTSGQTSRGGERKGELLMGGMVQPSPEGPARLTISGKMLIGSAAGMDAGGQLWPGLPRFLMGLPPEWCKAAIAAHRKMKSVKKKSPRAKPG